MYIDFIRMPARSGKTTLAIREFLKDPDQQILFAHNLHNLANIIREIKSYGYELTELQSKNIITKIDELKGKTPKRVIVDDMFDKKLAAEFNKYVHDNDISV